MTRLRIYTILNQKAREVKRILAMSNSHLDYCFMLFFDLPYKYFTATFKVYRVLKTCKKGE